MVVPPETGHRRQEVGALWIACLCAGGVLAAVVLTLLGFLGPFMRSALSESELYRVSQLVFYLVYGPTVGGPPGF